MDSFNILQNITKVLPPLTVVSDFPYGPVDRVAESLMQSGCTVSIVNLTTQIKAQSEYHALSQLRHIPASSERLFQKLKVYQTLFTKKHQKMDPSYDTFFANFDLTIGLENIAAIQHSELFLIGTIHGLYPWYKIPSLIRGKQAIIRMSTYQPVTGYCIYHAGCGKWKHEGCSNCPQLGLTVAGTDECKEHFERKKNALYSTECNFAFVTPSQWMCSDVQQGLIGKEFLCKTITSSVMLDTFIPYERRASKKALGIEEDCTVILTGSAGLRKNKGLHVLCEALSQLSGMWKKKTLLVFFGYPPNDTYLLDNTGLSWKALGWIDAPQKLAQVYSAADIFVSPSFQDNLPNTVNEALSCGTPVVCFDKMSSEDVVINGVTGLTAKHPGLPLSEEGNLIQPEPYTVSAEQCADLGKKIMALLALPEKERQIMRQNCRTLAEKAFSPARQAARYIMLYRDMLGLSHVVPFQEADEDFDYTQGLTQIDCCGA